MKHVKPFLLVLVLGFSLSVLPAFASDDGSDATCPKCGQGQMTATAVQAGEWEMTGKVPCIHNDPWALDEAQKRTIQTTYTCDQCGYTHVLQTEETRAVHRKE